MNVSAERFCGDSFFSGVMIRMWNGIEQKWRYLALDTVRQRQIVLREGGPYMSSEGEARVVVAGWSCWRARFGYTAICFQS